MGIKRRLKRILKGLLRENMNRIKEGDIVKHFKGDVYKVLYMNVKDCDDNRLRVIYMALYPPYQIYSRWQEEFLSKVPSDRTGITQTYRFELINNGSSYK